MTAAHAKWKLDINDRTGLNLSLCRDLPQDSVSNRTEDRCRLDMSNFTILKQWALRDGRHESELVRLVRAEIAPRYRQLPGLIRLELLRIEGTRSYLAVQRWQDRQTRQKTISSDTYENWLREYEPILFRWNEIMRFEEEWEYEGTAELRRDVFPASSVSLSRLKIW